MTIGNETWGLPHSMQDAQIKGAHDAKFWFSDLDSAALTVIAHYHEELAKTARVRAAELNLWEQQKKATKQRIVDAKSRGAALALTVAKFIKDGMNEETALLATTQTNNTQMITVKYWWKTHKRDKRKAATLARETLVMGLIRQGLKNKEISARTGLKGPSISRIKSRVMGRVPVEI